MKVGIKTFVQMNRDWIVEYTRPIIYPRHRQVVSFTRISRGEKKLIFEYFQYRSQSNNIAYYQFFWIASRQCREKREYMRELLHLPCWIFTKKKISFHANIIGPLNNRGKYSTQWVCLFISRSCSIITSQTARRVLITA